MINPKAMQKLFKPYNFEKFDLQGFLNAIGITMEQMMQIDVEDECSKSADESCINTDCHHNFLHLHEDELYIEVAKEVQAKRKAIEDKTKRDMEKHFGIKQ